MGTGRMRTADEIAEIEEMQDLVDQIVEMTREHGVDGGNSFGSPSSDVVVGAGLDYAIDTLYGAYYDNPAPRNVYDTAYHDHAGGYPLSAITANFELLHLWTKEHHSDFLNDASDFFDPDDDDYSSNVIDMILLYSALIRKVEDWLGLGVLTLEETVGTDLDLGETGGAGTDSEPQIVSHSAISAIDSTLEELVGVITDNFDHGAIPGPDNDDHNFFTIAGDELYHRAYTEGTTDWGQLYVDTHTIYLNINGTTDALKWWHDTDGEAFILVLMQELLSQIEGGTGWTSGQLLGDEDPPTLGDIAAAREEAGYTAFEGATAGSISVPAIDCEEPELEEELPPCPPPCQGDPDAISPNWTRQTEREPFLNSKTCEYSIALRTKYEATSIDNLYSDPNYLREGVEKLLDHYGKVMEPYFQTMEDGSEGPEVDPIQVCVDAGTIKETFVSTRPYVKMKALIVVPYDVFRSIEEQQQPEELPDRKNQPAFTTIEGEDFIHMVRQVARAMDIMAVRQAKWFWNEGGQLSEPTFNPKEEADRIRLFIKEMRNLLLDNEFKIRRPWGSRKWVDNFEIGFDADMGIDYVKALEKGCERPELMLKGMAAFKNSEPQSLPRTMYFVHKLAEMQADFTSAESIEFGDFLAKYVAFPPVTITVEAAGAYASEPIWCPPPGEDTALSTFDLGEELRDLGKSIMDEVLSFPDAFADRFANDLCATLEGKKKNEVKMNDLGSLSRQALDSALREYFAGDTFLNNLPDLLAKQTDGDPSKLWADILDQMGLCGLLNLIETALGCLLAGLGMEDVLKTMLNSALGAMSGAAFEVFMLGLPPEAKDEIRAGLSAEFKAMPAPWDADYRAGSYSGQGTKHSITKEQAPTGLQGEDEVEEMEITLENGSTTTVEVVNAVSEKDQTWQAQKEVTYMGAPTTVGNTTGVVINETAIGQSYGNSGSIGTALDKNMDKVMEAYREALLGAINNNLIDLDMLKDQLMSIPGAQLFSNIFKEMDCPPFPLFTPPLGNILGTLELSLCPGYYAIALPKFSIDVSIADIFKMIIDVAKELIKELVVKLLILILKKILEIIFGALCALLELIGGAVVDAITGGNAIKDALGGALCDDATEEDINEAMRKMLEATGLGDCAGPGDVPTTEDATAFTEIIASVLTNQEVLDLLGGSASPQVMEMVSDVVSDNIPGLSCMAPADIGTLFGALGTIVNPELFERAQQMDLEAPVCENICASPEQLEKFNNIRCGMMQKKGLSPEECAEQLENLRALAREDLADLANILQGGPFHNFPALTGNNPVCPDTGDPFAPGSSILPEIPGVLSDVANKTAGKIFDSIAEEHVDDLVGRRGFLDMVLSDSNGRGLKSHEATVNGPFGSPLTDDLGFFQNYTDNWMSDKGNNTELPNDFPQKEGDRGSAGDWGMFSIDHVGTGGFPLTVASLMQYYFASYNQKLTFALPVEGADTGEGPPEPMRGGEGLGYDGGEDDVTRGIPWENSTLNLYYRDYVKEDDESYAMRMEIAGAVEEITWDNSGPIPVPVSSEWATTDTTQLNIYETIEGLEPEMVSSYRVISNISPVADAVIDNLNTDANMPLPKKLFGELLVDKLRSYGATNTGGLKGVLRDQHGYLTDVYMRKFSLLMASNSEGTTDPAPNSFQYGYDVEQQVEAVYLGGDNETLNREFYNNNKEWYAGENYEYVTNVENSASQQTIFDRFGGSFNNPPYYMKNPERFGWLGMTDKLVPDPDACDPVDGTAPRESICKFDDLKDLYTDLMQKYQDDKRLFVHPKSSCGDPQPFSAVMTRGAAAGVDSIIVAMTRIFVIEMMLRGTAIFSVFGSECYDEVLSTYIIKFMDDELKQMGVWGLPSQKFYYYFMEQVVQMYGRQVDLGMITPTDGEQDALDNLNSYQLRNQIRVTGLFAKAGYIKELGEIVQEALDKEEDGRWTSGIRTLLSHFVTKEIKSMFKQFGDNLYPNGAPIHNIQSILFHSPAFIRGSVESGIPDVWNGQDGEESNVYEADLIGAEGTYPNLADNGEPSMSNGIGNHPFRLEKYISFEEAKIRTPPELRGIINIESFKDWARSAVDLHGASHLETEMSELFSGGKLGFRLAFVSSASERGDAEWGGADNTVAFINAFEEATEDLTDVALSEKTLKVSINTNEYTGVYGGDNEYMYMIPISSAEMDLGLDEGKTLQDFIDEIDGTVEDNQPCLLDEIAQSGEFEVMFGIAIPLKKMLSWLAIYTINNFLPSVGWVQDGWTQDGGKWIGFSGGFRSWDQKSFEKTKRETKRAFMRFYHTSDPTYEDDESKGRKDNITRGKKPRPNNNPGWRWFRWRRKIRKPTDKNEKLCP